MTIQNFIDKAIEGGWAQESKQPIPRDWMDEGIAVEAVLLDPAAWRAVEKVEKWAPLKSYTYERGYEDEHGEWKVMTIKRTHGKAAAVWKKKMHRMVDALIKGSVIDDCLQGL
jgi:hypothetical protein